MCHWMNKNKNDRQQLSELGYYRQSQKMKIIKYFVTRNVSRTACYRLRLLTLIAVIVLFIMYLHLILLPSSMGYYNDKCQLSNQEKENMRYLLHHVAHAFGELNVTYWIDYGTLLGAVRVKDILPHDGDVDIGRLMYTLKQDEEMESNFTAKMSDVGILANAMTAKYRTAQADLFRWKIFKNISYEQKVLVKWYPFVPYESLFEKSYNYFFPPLIPIEVIVPPRQISVGGIFVNGPNKPRDLLKIRYPFTWYLNFPYKWKCWV